MVGGLTYIEQRTHFAFWCMLAAPLILGNDPRHMSASTLSLLTNRHLIAINQDPLGRQAHRVIRIHVLADKYGMTVTLSEIMPFAFSRLGVTTES